MGKDVLVEIGLEELPARYIDDAERQLADKTKNWLVELRITHDSIISFSTPRRLTVLVKNVAEEQTTIVEEAKGPAKDIAKDANGDWTKAAIGFTKGQGKTVEDIYTKDLNGTTYIYVKKHIEGKQTTDLLPELRSIIESIQFGKNMRWAEQTLKYARPIRWLVALFGDSVIPFEVANVRTSNVTFGHRYLGTELSLNNPSEYQTALFKNYVVVDAGERERLILDGIKQVEQKENFQIPVDKELLDEVRNLVEYPTAFVGSYEKSFLQLPSEVLIISMKEHQRYFPVKSHDGTLLPYFVGVRNGDDYALDTVIKGNEKVLRARLADAQFFYEEDQNHSIDYYMDKLERVVFQEKLGTISDKVRRVVYLTRELAQLLNLDEKTANNAIRTAEISKFDLMSHMVNEFTELQGIIGEKYALNFGENSEVSKAIKEHYLPKQANGYLPESIAGSVVSIADKLDTIVGCISIGLIPTGSTDQYGLRRQATGILRIMQANKWNITLESLLESTKSVYQTLDIDQRNAEKVTNDLADFFHLRAAYLLKEMGVEQDVVQAVLHREIGAVDYTFAKATILTNKRNDDQFKYIQEALVRVLNLASKTNQTEVNQKHFETDSEQALYEKYEALVNDYAKVKEQKDAKSTLELLGELAEPIHNFFDHNMVMAEDDQIKTNRLALVNKIAYLILDYADLTAVEWKQQF
ncbi:glycyl-tRNA synthetase beta chain [Virgibacillus natechei]|uniref:Glycine--tRNA ligase beta subunit n=1 Tax=Virgibacillus natechei TaxID=1216297 RepID=A0ABS4ICN0_9BACI|nr:glycine--tRNA ligase subunit beta [Virgibacillus natechei]MBP1968695.1 glycyl-tRNA synthetase beta chain [Virgibacillus natechei]UZD11497.1 glycine--tRNA ligase subunit beta [Virgibacillus natechei]